MRGKIRRRAQVSLDDLAIQVGHNEILRLHSLVRNAAWLDDDQAFLAGDSAGVAESRKHQSFSDQVQIGLEDLFTQIC
jgi:hypothetical protein